MVFGASVYGQNIKLINLIEKIESAENVRFYFHEPLLDSIRIGSNINSSESLLEALDQIASISYFKQGNKIYITPGLEVRAALSFEDGNEETVLFEREMQTESGEDVIVVGSQSNYKGESTLILRGKITSTEDGKPVYGATVFTSDQKRSSISDNNGNYRLALPRGQNEVRIQFSGLDDKTIKVWMISSGSMDIKMEPTTIMLEEVAVSADADANLKAVEIGKSTLELSELDNLPKVLGETDLLQVALTLPGVQNVGEGSAGINVRGGKTDQNLILLNRAVVYNPFHFFGFFTAFNSDIIRNVDIYKGNIPVNYGGRLSSLLDINSQTGSKEKPSGVIGLSPVTTRASLETPIIKDKTSLVLGGRTTYSEWLLRQLEDQRIKQANPRFTDITGSIHHLFEDNSSLKVSTYYSKDKFRLTPDSVFSYENFNSSIEWDQVINENISLNSLVALSQYSFNIKYKEDVTAAFQYGFEIQDVYAAEALNLDIWENHQIKAGIDFRQYDLLPGFLRPLGNTSTQITEEISRERGRESSVFVSDAYQVTPNLVLNGGVRYSNFQALGGRSVNIYEENSLKSEASLLRTEEYSKNQIISTFGGPELRMSAVYTLPGESSIKGSYNIMRQYIHALSNNVTISPTATWKLSDPNFQPQVSHQFSAGYFRNFKLNTIETSIEAYYKTMQNLVDYKVGADLVLNPEIEQDIIQGEGRAYGVELLVRKNYGILTGWVGYTFSRSLQKFDSPFDEETINNGNFFPSNFDKPHNLTVVSNYKLTRRYSLSMNTVYATGRPITYPTAVYSLGGNEIVHFADRNKFRVPDYFRIDLSFNVEGSHRKSKLTKGSWSFSVYNLLARKNVYSIYFENSGGQIKGYKLAVLGTAIPSIVYNLEF